MAAMQKSSASDRGLLLVSDHCYMVSDPPSLFEPDFLKNARLSRIECN